MAKELGAKDVISLADLALRFSKAKGMGKLGYQWKRQAPGSQKDKTQKVGNSLAIVKAVKGFNSTNTNPIPVYNAQGYDGTNRKLKVIKKKDVIRLKGYVQRGSRKPGSKKAATPFKIVSKAEF
ncbi:hypothetical protein IIA79_02670 [bacterium]|nr:hypothetical protein [bacterium]